MFVTQPERQPLGGFFSFVLPMCVFGILAVLVKAPDFTEANFPAAAFLRTLPALVSTSVFALALSLLYLWHPARIAATSLAALAVALLATAVLHHGEGGARLLSWAAFLVLAGAATDDTESGLELPPAYRFVFPRLVSLPLMIIVVTIFATLFSVMLAAAFQATMSIRSPDAGPALLLPDINGSPALVGLLLFGTFLGIVVALIRYQRALIGSFRYALLVASRYLLPVICVVAMTFLLTSVGNANEERGAYFVMTVILLITVNLVYVDGTLAKPPAWIRVSVFVAAIVLLLLLWSQFGMAKAMADASRVTSDYGSIFYQLILTIFATFALVVGVISDSIGKSDRWMPALAPLNIAVIGLIGFAPLFLRLVP